MAETADPPSEREPAEALIHPVLPPDDGLRLLLHNEVHARPSARIRLPALLTYVAVLNAGVTREHEGAHLRCLPGQEWVDVQRLRDSFLNLRGDGYTLRWERHTEFTRYTVVQPLPAAAQLGASVPDLLGSLAVPSGWLAQIPGRTVAAIHLAMVVAPIDDAPALMAQALAWFGGQSLVASVMGSNPNQVSWAPVGDAPNRHGYAHPAGHSWALTQFRVGSDGFERMLVITPEGTTATRAGRIAQRLLELETYRVMALRGLPLAKALNPMLAEAEDDLARIAARMEQKAASDQELLDTLVALAARVERATAENVYRFSASRAYASLVRQRLAELREKAIPGTQTLGEFMQRRFTPAMATVDATAQRLTSLSERIARSSDLLRTRVDIATEAQNQQLLEKLTRGQELQLRLQTTVEGLSIAAISYYVISLVLYGGKALKALGVPINPEMAAGALVPLVLYGVWRTTQSIHKRLHHAH